MKKVFVTAIAVVFLSTIVSCESSTPVIFAVEPSSHNFGAVNISQTATFDFILTNKKPVDMTLTTIAFTTGEFSEITGAQGQIILAKGALAITVRFAPALPGGLKEDTMNIEWTDIDGKTGSKDVKLKGEAVPVPLIDAPATYDFGTVGIGQTATHNFNISNTGTADLILSLFNFNGNATLFSITAGGTVPVTVIPGATHSVTVQFAPIATGDFPTVLEITHNAINAVPPAQINIAAAGGGGRIEMNQTSPWDFDAVKQNGSKIDVVEISNTGSINLNIQSITLVTGNEFTIDSIEDSSGNPIAAPFGIAPSDFVEVTIKFSPTAIQNYQDTLEIANDGSYAPSPATLELAGSGRAPITQTFNYTGAAQNWNVPAGIGQIDVEVYGAESGRDRSRTLSNLGKGGKVVAGFTVQPGSSLGIYVGGKGNDSTGPIAQGGWNGGGNSGSYYNNYAGGGGGGASDIRSGGSALTDRFVVAGGGGGAGWWSSYDHGGDGGGLEGQNGADNHNRTTAGTGKGGTQSAGGAGGAYPGWTAGSAGSLGSGGNGPTNNNTGGGGGGGGYYGGGAGSWVGAGGGSSFTASGATGVAHTQGDRSGNGMVEIKY